MPIDTKIKEAEQRIRSIIQSQIGRYDINYVVGTPKSLLMSLEISPFQWLFKLITLTAPPAASASTSSSGSDASSGSRVSSKWYTTSCFLGSLMILFVYYSMYLSYD